MDFKAARKSKTMWFGLITAILPFFSNHAAELIQEHTVEYNMAWGFLIIALRYVTKGKIILTE